MLFSSLYNLSRYSIEWRIPEVYEDDHKIKYIYFSSMKNETGELLTQSFTDCIKIMVKISNIYAAEFISQTVLGDFKQICITMMIR